MFFEKKYRVLYHKLKYRTTATIEIGKGKRNDDVLVEKESNLM